jgi:hypothetical protein
VTLTLTFGDTGVDVHTTSLLTRLLESTHRRHRGASNRKRTVDVNIGPPDRSPERALRDVQRTIAAQVAAGSGLRAVQAVVVERGGRAIAFIGRPGSGKSTLAAHLLARGWRLVSDDVAFVDDRRTLVISNQALMTFGARTIPFLPAGMRAAVERSQWFVDEQGELRFYEVDPADTFGADVWSAQGTLEAIVVVDDAGSAGAVDPLASETVALYALDGSALPLRDFDGLRIGLIRNDGSRATAEAVERWYDAGTRA